MHTGRFEGSRNNETVRSKKQQRIAESSVMRQALNDPAAPLFILDTHGERDAKARIDIEFTTDMIERRPDRLVNQNEGLHTVFYFNIEAGHTLRSSDTGQTMDDILSSSVAAAKSEVLGVSGAYGLAREQARSNEADQIRAWLVGGGNGYFYKASLCPGGEELDEVSARRLNFRQSRMMSVNALYSLENGKIRADYFSVEGHTLELQNKILRRFGLESDATSSLGELSNYYELSSEDALSEIRRVVGQSESLNVDEVKLCTLKTIHFGLVRACAKSEKAASASADLVQECSRLGIPVPDGLFDRNSSRQILEHARSYGLPHYLYRNGVSSSSGGAYENGERVSAYQASTEAARTETRYSGDCPGGSSKQPVNTASPFISEGVSDGSIRSLLEFRVHNNMNELRGRLKGYGTCSSCGRSTGLFGCGIFCGDCNRTWCDEYERTAGRSMLEPAQVRSKRGIRTRQVEFKKAA